MVKIDKIESTDSYLIEKYSKVFKVFGWDLVDGAKVTLDDFEFLLFYCNGVFMRFYFLNGELLKDFFQIDSDGKVYSFTTMYEGVLYQVVTDENGLYVIDEDKNQHSLHLIGNKDNVDDVSNNGLLDYVQHNMKSGSSLVIRYEQYLHNSRNVIYRDYLRSPYLYKFIDFDKHHMFHLKNSASYYRLDFDVRDNKWQYDLASLEEFGVGAVVSNGSIALHNGEKSFSRYYKVLFSVGDYITITGFPFTKGYSEEDIRSYIESNGFNSCIPEKLVNLFNMRNELLSDYQSVIDAYFGIFGQDKSYLKK